MFAWAEAASPKPETSTLWRQYTSSDSVQHNASTTRDVTCSCHIRDELETTNAGSDDEPEETDTEVDAETLLALDRIHLLKGEAFLFHGTDRIAIDSIVQEGFHLRYCERGAFGNPGIYLSEHAQKADQYTNKTGLRSTKLYMLVVRVALGRTEMHEKKKSGKIYDTIVGGTKNLFREFVKTDTAQLYPEFVV